MSEKSARKRRPPLLRVLKMFTAYPRHLPTTPIRGGEPYASFLVHENTHEIVHAGG